MGTRPSARDVSDRLVTLKCCVIYAMGAPPREVVAAMRARATEKERAEMDDKADEMRDQYWTPIFDTPVFDALTESERALSESTLSTMTVEQQIDASWQVESIGVLAWALGLIDELPAWDAQVPPAAVQSIPGPRDLAAFRAEVTLRDEDELDDALTAAELWQWRSRTRELAEGGFTLPDELKRPGVHTLEDVIKVTTAAAFENGTIEEALGGDFPARGKPYRDLDDDEASELRSIAVERHRALSWLCGITETWDVSPAG